MERNPNWAAQLFLVLLPAAVGCLLGSLILDQGGGKRPFVIACLTVALVFAAAGAAAPVCAIKKPLRSYRFLAGIAHSSLSRQAALVGLFTALLLIHWILVLSGVYALWLGIVTVVVGAAAVLAAGLTYLLGAQPAWRHWSTPVSLLGGLLGLGVCTSLVIALGWRDVLLAGTSGGLVGRILVLVGVAGLATAIGGRAARDHRRSQLMGAVLVGAAGIAAAAGFAASWVIVAAFVAMLGALFVQWRLFFLTAAPLSWKAEVEWYVPERAAGKE